jgi:hypothetical protein
MKILNFSVAGLHSWQSKIFWLFAILTLLTGRSSAAADAPVKVVVGLYVNQIYGVSLKENKFTADFYVWFRYDDDELKPLENMEVVNGRIDSKSGIVKKKIDGTNYALCRIVATITKFWDVSRYPIDRHILRIEIEDGESDNTALLYTPDLQNAGLSPETQVRGWNIAGFEANVVDKNYLTNFGDSSLPTNNRSTYSRYQAVVAIDRSGFGQFFKLFGLMFLSTFVAFLAFLVSPSGGPRFGLGTGALFAAAANSFVVGSSLPESIGITLADQLQLTTILLIFTSILISTISLRLANSGKEEQSRLLDRIAISVLPLFYFGFAVWLILRPIQQT